MKYLQKYQIFESLKHYRDINTILDNMLLELGFSINAVNILKTTFDLRLNPDITQNKKSILYSIIDVLKDDMSMDELCPVFQSVIPYNTTNDRITFTIITNPKNTIDNYRTISANENNYYYKLLDNIIYTFERSTGEFNFYSETHLPDGPYIKDFPFLKSLILDYLNYLNNLNNLSDFNIDNLYKITSNNIVKTTKSYIIFQELERLYPNLYNHISKFNTPDELKNSHDMREMGFGE